MEPSFWHRKWANNETGFHQTAVNPFLQAHLSRLSLPVGGRVFVPLCGKSGDMLWLLQAGFQVVGAELSELAIDQLFAGLAVTPDIAEVGSFKRFSAPGITVFVGDVFDLTADLLGEVAAVYDRAALVALPPAMRARYAAHLMDITRCAPQLLVAYDYDQSQMEGPPFSVPTAEVERLYGGQYRLQVAASAAVDGGLKAVCPARETAWIMQAL